MPQWWDDLDTDEQKQYLKDHPRSKLKVKEKTDTKDDSEEDTPEPDEKDGAFNKAKKGVLSYIKENPGRFALAAVSTLAHMRKSYDADVEGMSPRKRSGLVAAIKTAISLKDSKSLRNLSFKVGVRTGALFLGATAFALVTGVDISFAVPILAAKFWDNIEHAPDDLTYLKNVGKAYVDSVKDNLENEDVVKKAVVKKKPDVVVDTDGEVAYAKFTITSNHETDLNKTIAQIEKANIPMNTGRVLAQRRAPKKSQSILRHMRYIEDTMPILTTILVAGISLRGNLSKRANEQLSLLSNDFKRCRAQLSELASSDSSLVKTPAIAKLKKFLKHTTSSSGAIYVSLETGCAQLCETHSFEQVETEENAYSNVTFYTFKHEGNLCIAHTINSPYIPKAFETIKISDLG